LHLLGQLLVRGPVRVRRLQPPVLPARGVARDRAARGAVRRRGGGAFAWLVDREWGERAVWASRTFAVLWPCVILTGEFPFLLGIALALLALVALQAGRQWLGALLIFATVAASPVAFVFLAVALVAVG